MLELLALEKRNKPLATYGDNKVTDEENDDVEDNVVEDDVDLENVSSNHDSDDNGENFPSIHKNFDSSDWTSDGSASVPIEKDDVFDVEKVTTEELFTEPIENDRKEYKRMKEVWDLDSDNRLTKVYRFRLGADEFMTFEEFTALRESWRSTWGDAYRHMLTSPDVRQVTLVPMVRELVDNFKSRKPWASMDWYEKWIVSMYGGEFVKKYGSLEAVDPNLIPVGMVELFRSSRMKLDQ